jgi:hypothetical protein
MVRPGQQGTAAVQRPLHSRIGGHLRRALERRRGIADVVCLSTGPPSLASSPGAETLMGVITGVAELSPGGQPPQRRARRRPLCVLIGV